jgi:hypothetical protein
MDYSTRLKENVLNAASNLSTSKIWLIYEKDHLLVFGSINFKERISQKEVKFALDQLTLEEFCTFEQLFKNQYLITLQAN